MKVFAGFILTGVLAAIAAWLTHIGVVQARNVLIYDMAQHTNYPANPYWAEEVNTTSTVLHYLSVATWIFAIVAIIIGAATALGICFGVYDLCADWLYERRHPSKSF